MTSSGGGLPQPSKEAWMDRQMAEKAPDSRDQRSCRSKAETGLVSADPDGQPL